MTFKLLTEHHLEFLSPKEGCTGWSESTFVKMPHCWKSHVMAHFFSTVMSAHYTCLFVGAGKMMIGQGIAYRTHGW